MSTPEPNAPAQVPSEPKKYKFPNALYSIAYSRSSPLFWVGGSSILYKCTPEEEKPLKELNVPSNVTKLELISSDREIIALIEGTSQLLRIDANSLELINSTTFSSSPMNAAVVESKSLLIIRLSSGALQVHSLKNLTLLFTYNTSVGSYALDVTSDGKFAYFSNSSNQLLRLNLETYAVETILSMNFQPRVISLGENNTLAFVALNRIDVFNLTSKTSNGSSPGLNTIYCLQQRPEDGLTFASNDTGEIVVIQNSTLAVRKRQTIHANVISNFRLKDDGVLCASSDCEASITPVQYFEIPPKKELSQDEIDRLALHAQLKVEKDRNTALRIELRDLRKTLDTKTVEFQSKLDEKDKEIARLRDGLDRKYEHVFFKGLKIKNRAQGRVLLSETSASYFKGHFDGRGSFYTPKYTLTSVFDKAVRTSTSVLLYSNEFKVRMQGTLPLTSKDPLKDITVTRFNISRMAIDCIATFSIESYAFSGIGTLNFKGGVKIQGIFDKSKLVHDKRMKAALILPDSEEVISDIADDVITTASRKKYKINYDSCLLEPIKN